MSSSYPVQDCTRLCCALGIPFISSSHCQLSALSTEKTMLVHSTQQSISCARYVIDAGSKWSVGAANKHLQSQRLSISAKRKIPARQRLCLSDGRGGANLPYSMSSLILQTVSWQASTSPQRILTLPNLLLSRLSLQNAVGAEGTGTDVTGSRPHLFSTLPVLIGCNRAMATAQLPPSPQHWL